MKKILFWMVAMMFYISAPFYSQAQYLPTTTSTSSTFTYVSDELIISTRVPVEWDMKEQYAHFITMLPAGSKVVACADACLFQQDQEKVRQGKYRGTRFLVKLPTPTASLWESSYDVRYEETDVEYIWVNKIGKLQASSPISMSDPTFATSQSHLEYDLAAIAGGVKYTGVHHAYGYVFKNTNKLLCAILDGGLNYNHQDAQNIWYVNTSETLNGIDDDGDGYVDNIKGWDFVNSDNDPTDDNTTSGHGTHVAGIMGARNNNSYNICGIITDTASLLILKTANSSGSGTDFWASAGYYLALSKGARVVNMSFIFSTVPSSLMSAIATGISTYKCVPVAGSGNSGSTYYYYPASGSSVLTVGATNSAGTTWATSTLSDSVDIQAVGVSVVSLSATSNTSTFTNSGTSMATPFISAMVWRILKADTSLTVSQVIAKVRSRGLNGAFTTGVGWGYFSGVDTMHYNDMKPDSVAFAACSGKKALPFMKYFKTVDSLRYGLYAIANDSINTNIIAPGTYTYKVAWKSEPRASVYYQDTFTCKVTITGTGGSLARDTTKIIPDTTCSGTSVTATAYTNYTTSAVPKSWYLDNVFYGNNPSSMSFTGLSVGLHRVKYVAHLDSASSGCYTAAKDTSLIDSFYVKALVTPTISISVSPNDTVCASTTLNFSSTGSNLGTAPTYQWQRYTTSWGNITGATSSTYSVLASLLTSGDSIRLQVTSSEICPTTATVVSIPIKIVVKADTAVTASVTPGTSGYCVSGGSSLLTSSTNITGASYQWYIGVSSIPGATSSTYTSTGLAAGTYSYHVVITSTIPGGCYSPASATSTSVTVNVTTAITPSLSEGTTTPAICNENTASLTSSCSVVGATNQWQQKPPFGSWANIPGATSPSYTTSTGLAGGTHQFRNIYTMPAGCYTQNIDTTNPVSVVVTAATAPTPITITAGTQYQAGTTWFRDYSVSPSVDVEWYRKVGGVWVFQVHKTAGTPWIHTLDAQGDTVRAVYVPAGCYSPDSSFSNVLQLSSPVSVAAVPSVLHEVKIYPNPTTAVMFITGLPDDCRVAVYSVVGSKVSQNYTSKYGENLTVDLQSLAAGTYSVRVETPTGEKHAYMVVKQ